MKRDALHGRVVEKMHHRCLVVARNAVEGHQFHAGTKPAPQKVVPRHAADQDGLVRIAFDANAESPGHPVSFENDRMGVVEFVNKGRRGVVKRHATDGTPPVAFQLFSEAVGTEGVKAGCENRQVRLFKEFETDGTFHDLGQHTPWGNPTLFFIDAPRKVMGSTHVPGSRSEIRGIFRYTIYVVALRDIHARASSHRRCRGPHVIHSGLHRRKSRHARCGARRRLVVCTRPSSGRGTLCAPASIL